MTIERTGAVDFREPADDGDHRSSRCRAALAVKQEDATVALCLFTGAVLGWALSGLWNKADIEAGRKARVIIRHYEGVMSPRQVRAAKARLRDLSEAYNDCLEVSSEQTCIGAFPEAQ